MFGRKISFLRRIAFLRVGPLKFNRPTNIDIHQSSENPFTDAHLLATPNFFEASVLHPGTAKNSDTNEGDESSFFQLKLFLGEAKIQP